jgi:hypothetical protein
MIALSASLFLLFYVLVPGAMFRLGTSFAVPLKKFHKTKSQEVTFAVVAAFLPFWFAMALVWYPVSFPFKTPETHQQRKESYRIIFSSFTTDKAMDDATKQGKFWPSLNSVLKRQSRFLFWYYCFVAIEATLFWYLASRHRKFRGIKLYDFLVDRLLIPNISEWYVILTDFAVPTDTPRIIEIDVLSTEDILYRGRVSDYFLDAEGELTGVLLSKAERFERDKYIEHKTTDFKALIESWPQPPKHTFAESKEKYWSRIPGAGLFYIPKDKISNLNVRHAPEGISQAVQARLKVRGINIKQVVIKEEPRQDKSVDSPPDQP